MMKSKIILTLIVLLNTIILSNAYAQQFKKKYNHFWPASTGWNNFSKFKMSPTSDNGFIYVGQEGYSSNNTVVVKLNNKGCVEWSYAYNVGFSASGTMVKQLDDGGFLVGGIFEYPVANSYIMKIDHLGNIIWTRLLNILSTPTDCAQTASELAIITGSTDQVFAPYPSRSDSYIIKLNEMNGIINSIQTLSRIPIDITDIDNLCFFNRIIPSNGGGYCIGGTVEVPYVYPNSSVKALLFSLDNSGNLGMFNTFTTGISVNEIINKPSGNMLLALENHDYIYDSYIPNSRNRMTLMEVNSSANILWQKFYAPPYPPIVAVASHIPNSISITNNGDLLIGGIAGQFDGFNDAYIFKTDPNGNMIGDMYKFTAPNHGFSGMHRTVANDNILSLNFSGVIRFGDNLNDLCDINTVPLISYTDTATHIEPEQGILNSIPDNSISIIPIRYNVSEVVETVCGNACDGLPCYDSTTSSLTSSLLAYYPFGGGSLLDYSGNGHDLSNSTSAHPTTDRNGNLNCAYNFSKSNNDFLNISSPTFIDNLTTAPFSISLWYQPIGPRSISDYEQLIGRDIGLHCPDTYGQWSIGLYDCRKAVAGLNQKSEWQTTTTDCNTFLANTTNTWHHLAYIYNGSTSNLYVDGILYNVENGICGNMPLNVGDFLLGKDFTGNIDDIFIYNAALNLVQVSELHNLGSSCCNYIPMSIHNNEPDFKSSVFIYPNPSSCDLNLETQETIQSISISDINGRILKTQNSHSKTINISDLSPGLYFIRTETPNGIFINKIIKE